jgi:hypothetical protein
MSAGTADRSVAEIRQPAGDGSAAGLRAGVNPKLEQASQGDGIKHVGLGEARGGSSAGVGTNVCSGQAAGKVLSVRALN